MMSEAEKTIFIPSAGSKNADPPSTPRPIAHVIKSDAEAIESARAYAETIKAGASNRDRERVLPRRELDAFSTTGLWGITVPKAYGGADVSYVTVGEVVKIVSAADPNIGQIPQNHFGVLDIVRITGSESQKRFFFAEVLQGKRFGNAFSERHSKYATEFLTRIEKYGDHFVVNGEKFYSTGALFADWIPIAATGEDGKAYLAFVKHDAPGLEIIDDWSGFGQRTTASGTVLIRDGEVSPERVIPAYQAYDNPTPNGPVCQIIQAAVDAGIAKAAIGDTIAFVRGHARPWADSGLDQAFDDPYTIAAIGDLETRYRAAEALIERAGRAVDQAIRETTEASVAEASIAVAEAKILTTEIALLASSTLFELSGTRSVLAEHNLDRHWRNARTHTLHDPVRWKPHHIGNYILNNRLPPRHAWL